MSSTLRQRAPSPTAGANEKAALLREAETKEANEGKQFVVPNYTVKELLNAIPAHCFHRSAIRSSLYVVQDVIAIGALVYGALHIESFLQRFNLSPIVHTVAKVALWATYQLWAGFFGTGLWIIAHECGHQSYSSSKRINNAVGWVLHSALLVPYHSWRISHGQHHAATGHLERDQVFVPKTRSELSIQPVKEEEEVTGLNISNERQSELREALEDAPIVILWNLVLHQIFGWPLYLIKNASGQTKYPAGTNHFSPSSIIFRPQHKMQIIASDIGLLIVAAGLAYWSFQRTFTEMFLVYGIPYLYVNNWLVMITFLQHTDPNVPHYSAEKWTFARGALATVDRNFFGFVGPYILHGITETHVAHHTASKIPHYHAWEATAALKEFLGVHYQYNDENFLVAFYKNFRDCLFIEDGEDIPFYKNASGLAKRFAVEGGGNISDSGVDMTEPKDEE